MKWTKLLLLTATLLVALPVCKSHMYILCPEAMSINNGAYKNNAAACGIDAGTPTPIKPGPFTLVRVLFNFINIMNLTSAN